MNEPQPPSRFERYRPLLLLLLAIAFFAIGKWTGVTDDLDADKIRKTVADAGPLGIVIYVLIFAAGELMHVPGLVFVGAAVLAWGPVNGYLIGLCGSLGSVSLSFVIVRLVGGKALTRIERPFIRKILARLDQRPVTTVIVLRSLLWLSPPLNYALAMSSIRFRDYMIGSSLGLILPVLGMVVAAGYLFS